jgi:hypothetical protein
MKRLTDRLVGTAGVQEVGKKRPSAAVTSGDEPSAPLRIKLRRENAGLTKFRDYPRSKNVSELSFLAKLSGL